jgi:hypothetical protein
MKIVFRVTIAIDWSKTEWHARIITSFTIIAIVG